MHHLKKINPNLIVAVVMLLVAILVLVTAYDYGSGSGLFPRFIGWIFLVLTVFELSFQLKDLVTGPPIIVTNTGPGQHAGEKNVIKEIKGFLWIVFFLVILYFTGFLISIPLYMFTFLYVSAKRKLLQCVIISTVSTAFVYVLFVELLDYKLYPGVLFGG